MARTTIEVYYNNRHCGSDYLLGLANDDLLKIKAMQHPGLGFTFRPERVKATKIKRLATHKYEIHLFSYHA